MGSFIARRLLAMVPLLVLISLGVFALVLLVPGDPARTLAGGIKAQPAEVMRIRHQLHLDEPFLAQYWRWLSHVLRGDLGTSLFQRGTVASGIVSRFPLTLSLALGGLVVSVLVGVPLGVLSGTRPGPRGARPAPRGARAGGGGRGGGGAPRGRPRWPTARPPWGRAPGSPCPTSGSASSLSCSSP